VEEFLVNLSFNLQAEGFSADVVNRVMAEYTEIGFAKTASKSVLGTMNQLTFEAEYLILHRYEGMDKGKILKVNKDINRSLMRGNWHLYPIEMLQELLTGVKVPRPRISQ
jgi:hypothetical protein